MGGNGNSNFCSELGVALVVIPLVMLLMVAAPQVFVFVGVLLLIVVVCAYPVWAIYKLFTDGLPGWLKFAFGVIAVILLLWAMAPQPHQEQAQVAPAHVSDPTRNDYGFR